MKYFIAIALTVVSVFATAEDKMKMTYKNEDLTVIIENYSKASGQKFIVDSTVRGKITILNSGEVAIAEAFNQLSEALAVNGFAIVTNGDMMTVRNARSAQRDNIEVFTAPPPAKPQKMATWIANLKYASATAVLRELRMMSSSYGEVSSLSNTNQLVITDWTSNIQRVAELIKKVDIPVDPSLKKIVEQSKKERAAQAEEFKQRAHAENSPQATKPSKLESSEN